ncbi:MAG: hypothetical protein ACM31O_21040 [Bacteroidota bacterium]
MRMLTSREITEMVECSLALPEGFPIPLELDTLDELSRFARDMGISERLSDSALRQIEKTVKRKGIFVGKHLVVCRVKRALQSGPPGSD